MKPVVGIFAHPDDEAFGPGGTLATFAKERDVYLICVTNGDAGKKSIEDGRELSEIRREELLASSKIIGVKEVFFLGYKDGTLCNNLYHEIADKIQAILEDLRPEILLTFNQNGVSGHIDHIAVSMISSFVFKRLSFIQEIWYHTISEKTRELSKDYFIYFPHGFAKEEVDKVIDTSPVWDIKVKAMQQHKSQAHDIKKVLTRQLNLPKEEYFLVTNHTTI